MIALFMPVILCVTVVAAVALGIFSAYAAVITILRAFGRNSHSAPTRLVLVSVATQNHASGD